MSQGSWGSPARHLCAVFSERFDAEALCAAGEG